MDIAAVGGLFALIDPSTLWNILQGAIGLGVVIFVHELGHFAVAKWCGVKCEKFYLGFDIFGLKLAKFQWGETEYGIGILPLGGYVKMLGQDDNPQAAEAERQRSMLPSDDPNAPVQVDPRSYIAKSVPQRMAIISAGVVMNLIFCFLVAAFAYGLGVSYIPADFLATVPGSPAWKAGLRSGDSAVAIDGVTHPRFYEDLMIRVMLGSTHPIDFEIERPGLEKPFNVPVEAARIPGESRRTIGVQPTFSTTLAPSDPTFPGSAASRAEPSFMPGDRITAVNGKPVTRYYDLQRAMIESPGETLTLTISRPPEGSKPTVSDVVHNSLAPESKEITIQLPPQPVYELGLTMEYGPIKAVQSGSPAAAAGLKPGDQLLAIDGEPIGNPLFLEEQLRRRAGETVTVRVRREGSADPIETQVTLREVTWVDNPVGPIALVSVPALGIAIEVLDRVESVDPNGPAFKGGEGIRVGDRIVSWTTLIPIDEKDQNKAKDEPAELKKDSAIPLSGKRSMSWPSLNAMLQRLYRPGTKIVLHTEDGRDVEIEPVASDNWFHHDRGLSMINNFSERTATSVPEALALGGRETWENIRQVYLVLRGLVTGELGIDNVGGPFKIFAGASASASIGFSKLLMFLAVLSANLAVINFLPIPVLDGGHMVFLIAEGIRGKPVDEKIVMRFTLAGFLCIILLMITVLGMDIQWLWSMLR